MVEEGAGGLDGKRVLDLYGGLGVHAFTLLRAGAARATVCDADADAIGCGREAARRSGERRVAFHHDDAARFLRGKRESLNVDVVVANPPRTGMGQGVNHEILRMGPHRLVIVSCDPATLARDLRVFADGGYRVERVTPVDLFPQTAHIEAVAVLSRPLPC